VAAAIQDAGAQSRPPCATVDPALRVTTEDIEAGAGGTLTATHTIGVSADFPDGSSPEDLQVSAPAGVHVDSTSREDRIVSDTPGALPLTLSWTQLDSNGTECTASMGVTLQLQAPVPLAFGKLPRTLQPKRIKLHGRYYSGGWVLTGLIGRYTDLRPLELRFRGIGRARLPSPSMPFKIAMVPLRALEPGIDKQRYLRSPKWQVTAHVNYARTAVFVEAAVKTGSTHDHPVGYELQALQAGRPMIHVRAAGTCNFGGCKWRTFKVERGS
jgi:hypothetical protein